MIPTPCALRSSITSNSTTFSASVSDAVGSSKITALASTVSARAISTICWLAMDRSPTRVGRRSRP
jgi:hypothetical protein